MVLENSKGKYSKTKVGAVLIGAAAVLGTLGGIISGNISLIVGFQTLITEVGIVWGLFGLRDLPFLNKK